MVENDLDHQQEMNMKKLSILLTVVAVLAGNLGHAQTPTKSYNNAPKNTSKDEFQWGVAAIGLTILGVIVGCTAASAASAPSSYSAAH